jgi:hypothetical protein
MWEYSYPHASLHYQASLETKYFRALKGELRTEWQTFQLMYYFLYQSQPNTSLICWWKSH